MGERNHSLRLGVRKVMAHSVCGWSLVAEDHMLELDRMVKAIVTPSSHAQRTSSFVVYGDVGAFGHLVGHNQHVAQPVSTGLHDGVRAGPSRN